MLAINLLEKTTTHTWVSSSYWKRWSHLFQLHSQPHYILCHHTFPSSMPYMKLMRTSSSNPSNSVTLVAIQGRITSTFTFVISTCKRETLCGSCLFLQKPSPSRHPCWKEDEAAITTTSMRKVIADSQAWFEHISPSLSRKISMN